MLKKLQVFLFVLVLVAISATGLSYLFFLSQYSDAMNEKLLASASELFVREFQNGASYQDASDSVQQVFNAEGQFLRITLVDSSGTVLTTMKRMPPRWRIIPEEKRSARLFDTKGMATNKRHSSTLDSDMLYMARFYPGLNIVVRTAVPLILYQSVSDKCRILLWL